MVLQVWVVARSYKASVAIEQLDKRIHVPCREKFQELLFLNVVAMARVDVRNEVGTDKILVLTPKATIGFIFHTMLKKLVELRFILDVFLAFEFIAAPKCNFRRSFLLQ